MSTRMAISTRLLLAVLAGAALTPASVAAQPRVGFARILAKSGSPTPARTHRSSTAD